MGFNIDLLTPEAKEQLYKMRASQVEFHRCENQVSGNDSLINLMEWFKVDKDAPNVPPWRKLNYPLYLKNLPLEEMQSLG